MAIVIEEEKVVTFYVNETFRTEENFLVQTFTFKVSNKKFLHLLYDKRYLFKVMVDNMLLKENLEDYTFLVRKDYDDKIEMYYQNDQSKKPSFSTKIITLSNYYPPHPACVYCKYATQEGVTIYCSEKKKHFSFPGNKRCAIFKSINKSLT